MNKSFVYITSNCHHESVHDIVNNGVDPNKQYPGLVLYTGITGNLYNRIAQHKNHADNNAFTAQYNCHILVFFQEFHDINHAIKREKQIKNWRRCWKLQLVTQFNPLWKELFYDIGLQ